MSLETELTAIHNSLLSLHKKVDSSIDAQSDFVTKKQSWIKTGVLATFIAVLHGVVDFKDAILKALHLG